MTRFECRGAECEDTCCADWRVTVDAASLVRLERGLVDPIERARVLAIFAPLPTAERTPFAAATIRLRDGDGRCPLLEADGLCGLHQRHGEALLPDVCSSYPRILADVGGRRELLGALSCPEVVRQALLVEDGVELVEVDEGLAGRAPVLHRPDEAQLAWLDEVRGLALLVLDGPARLAGRLYHLAYLAEALGPALADGAPLDEEAEAACDEGVAASLWAEVEAAAPSEGGARFLVSQLARLRSVVRPRLGAELDATLVAAGLASQGADAGFALAVDAGTVAGWRARARALPPDALALVERALGAWARDFAFRELARPGATLPGVAQQLVGRAWVLRLLALLHPAAEEGPLALGEWLVRLCHGVARVADHDAAVRAFLAEDARAHLGALAALPGLLAIG